MDLTAEQQAVLDAVNAGNSAKAVWFAFHPERQRHTGGSPEVYPIPQKNSLTKAGSVGTWISRAKNTFLRERSGEVGNSINEWHGRLH